MGTMDEACISNPNSIVQQLMDWTATRREMLDRAGIHIKKVFPPAGDELKWKSAAIGLIKDEITVDFAVWEQTEYRADLTVVGGSGDALQIEYLTPPCAEDIVPVLDAVVARLAQGAYV